MRIFWFSIKNYFKSLRFVFTPLGVMALFLIISLSIAIPSIISSVKSMVTNISTILGGYSIDWNEVSGHFTRFLLNQDWSNPSQVLVNFMNIDYLKDSFMQIIREIFPNVDVDISSIVEIVQTTIAEIFLQLLSIVVMLVIGFIIGFFLTRMFVKQDVVKRKIWQRIVFAIVDAIISLLVIWGIIKAIPIQGWNIVIITLILLAHMVLTIIEGWVIHGVKRIKLKEVLNIKNLIFLLLANILIIALGVGTVLLINLLKMIVVTIVIGLSLFATTNAAVCSNAEGYVGFLVHGGLVKEGIEAKKAKKAKKSDENKPKEE